MPSVKCTLVRRDGLPGNDSESGALSSANGPILIGGVTLCGLIVLGVATWLVVRIIRKRNKQKLEDARGAAFLTVRGIVKDGGTPVDQPGVEKGPLTVDAGGVHGMSFSRNQLTPTVVMPDKVLLKKPPVTRDEIIESHRQSGTLPKPFSFALNASVGGIPAPKSSPRLSYMSVSSNHSGRRFSVMSTASAASSLSAGNTRKIRQEFDPVLPDELLVSVGERLTVIESFDDGWCLVGRENSAFATTAKSLFGNKPASDSNIELGVIPAWCFIQSVKGLRTERPVRSSSLGITVKLDSPAGPRNDVMSWSNF